MQKTFLLIFIGLLGLFFFSDQLNFFKGQDHPASEQGPPSSFNENLQFLSLKSSHPMEAKTQTHLTKTLGLHRRFIEKCFIRHYERNKGNTSAGQMELEFSISKKGHLENPTILKSDYQDQEFHGCVQEVFSRVKLKFYDGHKRRITLPLKLALPH